MSTFSLGEIVRIADTTEPRAYIIKDMKKIRKKGVLYLLKPLDEDGVLRLYYEYEESLLERMA